MKKVISIIFNIICVAFLLWMLLSWVDVLAHNNPLNKDMHYRPTNAFVLIGELGEVIYDGE